jgi:hypothetical protein
MADLSNLARQAENHSGFVASQVKEIKPLTVLSLREGQYNQ